MKTYGKPRNVGIDTWPPPNGAMKRQQKAWKKRARQAWKRMVRAIRKLGENNP